MSSDLAVIMVEDKGSHLNVLGFRFARVHIYTQVSITAPLAAVNNHFRADFCWKNRGPEKIGKRKRSTSQLSFSCIPSTFPKIELDYL